MTGQRWFVDADDNVVPEGDPSAVRLIAGVADELPEGYKVPKSYKAPGVAAEDEADEAPKSRRPAADKSRKPAADK